MVSHSIHIDYMLEVILCVKINTSAYIKWDCGSVSKPFEDSVDDHYLGYCWHCSYHSKASWLEHLVKLWSRHIYTQHKLNAELMANQISWQVQTESLLIIIFAFTFMGSQ